MSFQESGNRASAVPADTIHSPSSRRASELSASGIGATVQHSSVHRSTSRPLTPLMRASAIGHVELVRELLLEGPAIDERGPRESTALMFAAGGGHLEIVQLLVHHGADPFLCEGGGWTALDHAIADGEEPVVNFLSVAMESARARASE